MKYEALRCGGEWTYFLTGEKEEGERKMAGIENERRSKSPVSAESGIKGKIALSLSPPSSPLPTLASRFA